MKLKIVLPALLGAVGIGFLMSKKVSENTFKKEVNQLFQLAGPQKNRKFTYAQLQGLPKPVQQYFRLVLKEGQPYISYVRLKHNGQFKTDLKKDWMDISGEQYFTTTTPGFVWRGKTKLFTATDKYVNQEGGLQVKLLSSVKMVDANGEEYNQGELIRWLGESAWFPTNLLPSHNLFWSPIDAESALLTYNYHNLHLEYKVRFKPSGEITSFETQRYMGDSQLETWRGKFSNYREMNGVLVPTTAIGAWVLNGQEYPYANFNVLELEYNQPALF